MKKFTLSSMLGGYAVASAIAFMSFSVNETQAQCPDDNAVYLTWVAPTIVGGQVSSTCTYGGEYNRVTGMVANNEYWIFTCGNTNFDTQLTIYPAGGGPSVGYDDDACGAQSEIYFQPGAAGDYDMLIDEFSCASNTTCMDMTVELTCIASIAPTGINATTNPVCAGQTTQLSVQGGTLGTGGSWEWYSGSCGGVYVGSGGTISVAPLVTTIYYVRGEDNCYTSSCAILTVQVTAPTADAGVDVGLCTGGNVQLNATGGVSYSWSPASGLSCTNCQNPLANPLITTVYTVTVTDGNGCTDTDQVTVSVGSPPTANAGNDVSICPSGNTTLNATGGVSCAWSPTTGLSNPNICNPVASPLTATIYTVTVTDGNSCTDTASVTVSIGAGPTLATNTVGADCGGANGSATAIPSGQAPFTYQWDVAAANQTTQTATGLASGIYCVTVTDLSNCTVFTCVTVYNLNGPTLATEKVNDDVGGPCDGSATVTPSGGSMPYTYLWSDAQTDSSATGLCGSAPIPTVYSVTVTDTSGCIAIATFDIYEWALGIASQQAMDKLSVYPNPTSGEFVIEMFVDKSQDFELIIMSTFGQVVHHEQLTSVQGNYQKRLNLEGISGGVYLLQLLSNSGTENRKIIIE